MSNSVKLASRMDPDGNMQAQYDTVTQETILRLSAAVLDDDFIGPGHASIPTNASAVAGYPWIAHTTVATLTPVANFAGGAFAATLSSASSLQEAVLYAGDTLNWDVTKYANFETRLALSVIPTGVAEMVWGLASAYVAGPDNVARYIQFQVSGNGNVNVRIKDGVGSAQTYATGWTLVAGVFHNFRIDVSNPANVLFFIDGVRVSPAPPSAGMTFAATGTNAVLQPYLAVYKSATTDVGTMQIDSVQVSMNRV